MLSFEFVADSNFPGINDHQWFPHDGVSKSFKKICFIFKFNVFLKGYTEHAISVVTEWILVISTIIALATFYKDFKNIKLDKIKTFDNLTSPTGKSIYFIQIKKFLIS